MPKFELNDAIFPTTGKPTIEFKPPLVEGVAREGTTITMNCDCGELKEFEGDITWNWLIDNGSPPASKIRLI